ncbi:MAG: hypothetical protein EXR72_22455 [Myxococcales bacterium]|nr:hypothetical protein [Myxococcales bacterium]
MKRIALAPASLLMLLLASGCSDPPVLPKCAPSQIDCPGACVDPLTDAVNCGGCNIKCANGESCIAGKCASAACSPPTTKCATGCANLMTDAKNCGECGKACPEGEGCVDGKCGLICPQGQAACDKSCTNLLSDPAHCGDCMTKCLPGNVCSNGKCGVDCQQGLTNCDGLCINLLTDLANCGVCKTACMPGSVCSNGKCDLTCQGGLDKCNGTCVDLKSNNANCGACDTVCPGGQLCSNGLCGVSCVKGFDDCKGVCADLQTDNANCGVCGMACMKGQLCSGGMCGVSCQQGLENCNGTCANLQTDNTNCGKCNAGCPKGQACALGKCEVGCQQGLDNCKGVCVNLQTDLINCGVCDTICPNGTVCKMGKCAPTCALPLTECNMMCVNPQIDPSHCGGCGKVCMLANAVNVCVGGACAKSSCTKPFDDCDVTLANGCETNLDTDAKNCAKCGTACAVGSNCCGALCSNPLIDAKNCGKCGTACAMGLICCSGTCQDPKILQTCLDCLKACVQTVVVGVDFGKGVVDQLKVTANGLTTPPAADNPPVSKSPNVWVCNHNSNNVTKIDAVTGVALGTFPSGGGNPSRGAQAFDGSFWAGHRGQNCNVNDPNCSNVTQIKIDGTIGCQFKKAADGAGLPFVRAMAIDANGFIWFSTWNDARLHKGDPIGCKVVLDIPGRYAYGMSIDSKGVLWTQPANSGNALITGIDTKDGKILYEIPQAGRSFYGIVADRQDNVWFANTNTNGGAYRLSAADHKTITPYAPGPGGSAGSNGITIDTDGNIWAAGASNPGRLYKFKPDGTALLNIPTPALNLAYGMSGDTYGKVWATGLLSNNVSRINKDTGVVELTTALGGTYPYTYSDWNSVVLRTVTSNNAQAGTWSQVVDATKNGTLWTTADWTQMTPMGTQASTEFRFSDVVADLDKPNQPVCGPFFTPPVNLQTFCKDAMMKNYNIGRYVKTTVRLSTTNVMVQPTFNNLKFYYQQ